MTMCFGDGGKYDDGKNHDSDLEVRDYFAGKALQGFISNPGTKDIQFKELSKLCYKIADVMMKERDK